MTSECICEDGKSWMKLESLYLLPGWSDTLQERDPLTALPNLLFVVILKKYYITVTCVLLFVAVVCL